MEAVGAGLATDDALIERVGLTQSSYTGPNGGDCVEVNQQLSDVVGVRDSKQPDGGALVVDRSCWRSFLAAVVGGGMTPGA